MTLTKPSVYLDENRTAPAPVDALLIAADVLEEEANQLCDKIEGDEASPNPHRVKLSIRREIDRLRRVATALRKNIPISKDELVEEE